MLSLGNTAARSKPGIREVLSQLADQIETVEERSRQRRVRRGNLLAAEGSSFGAWGAVLSFGALHEWFGVGDGEAARRGGGAWAGEWSLPMGLLMWVARCASGSEAGVRPRRVVWIGRRCWPYPRAMGRGLLACSIFVDAVCRDERVWASDLAMRCGAVAAVVADGSGLTMAETRRLQLAAGAGDTMGLIARPAGERGVLSAAKTRWLVSCRPSPEDQPRWRVELLRCKGVRPLTEDARRWVALRDHETGDVHLVSDAGDRPAEAAGSQIERYGRTA